MRKIRFRGKDIETDKWVDGDLIQRMGYMPSIMFPYNSNGKVRYGECAVKRETVGQFTGLLDNSGKEIYEGEILNEVGTNRNVVVVYDAPEFCYADNAFGYRFLNLPENYIVVGNIHDNPELLKK